MGQVHPPPPDDPDRTELVERNLTAVSANFAALGYRRLIYTKLDDGLRTSLARSRVLAARVDGDTARVATDGRGVIEIATEIVELTG
jgi:hypothetical protein